MTLVVAAGQAASVPGDTAANVATAARLTRAAADRGARMLVLPEAFLTGSDVFTGALPDVEALDLAALEQAARDTGVTTVVGAALARSGEKVLASVVVGPGGSGVPYVKQHLDGAEKGVFTVGDHGTSITVDGIELGLAICYDGCFPEHARAAAEDGAAAYLVSAAWFPGGEHRRDLHAAARALENGIYVVFSGLTGPGFSGGSAIYDPEGRPVARMGAEEGVVAATLDLDLIARTQERHTMLRDHRDGLGARVRA